MRIGVLGINHKLANVKLREKLAKVCQNRFGAGCSIHGEHSFILLSTCNRTEIYFASPHLARSHSYLLKILRSAIDEEFDQKLYSYFGHDCFLHLCRVTSGLDSAIVAETEIQGQVKAAYQHTQQWGHLPSSLHFTFQKALKIGKDVRSHLKLDKGIPDLEHAVLHLGNKYLPFPQEGKLLLVGASKINLKLGSFLKQKGVQDITLCNRTYEKSIQFSEKYGFTPMPWEELPNWTLYDWVIVATKASKPILHNCPTSTKLLLDLSVPRNIDPTLSMYSSLFNIDQINEILSDRRPLIGDATQEAEHSISFKAKKYTDIYRRKQLAKKRLLATA